MSKNNILRFPILASVVLCDEVPDGVPASFDCAMRKLAYAYGKQLLPRQGRFDSLHSALSLDAPECSTAMIARQEGEQRWNNNLPANALFVDPEVGVDDNDGTQEMPLKSIHTAVNKAPRGGTVVLRGGSYFLDSTLQIGAAHSGLTIQAYPGETPVVSGGKKLQVAWEPYDVGSHWEVYTGMSVVSPGVVDDETIRSFGKQVNSQACKRECANDSKCTSFTWHDANQGNWANDCWGRLDGEWEVASLDGHISGRVGDWQIVENTNAVADCGVPDGKTCQDLGKQPDASACASACDVSNSCSSFTWHDASQGDWANACYAHIDGKWSIQGQPGHTSGRKGTKSNIYKANIQGQVEDVPGLQLDGVRATRARYPNLDAGLEVSPGYGGVISKSDADWKAPVAVNDHVFYYTDSNPDRMRNDTTSDGFQHYTVGIHGSASVYDPPVSFWCAEHWGSFAVPSGVTPKPGVLPNAPYRDVSHMQLNLWHVARWESYMFDIADYNPATNEFTFSTSRGGNQGARGSRNGGDFSVENVFEELDVPGEFFYAADSGDLFLFFNGTGSPPEGMEVVTPQLRTLINVSGTRWDPVRDLVLDGLHFKAARYTYMDPHGIPSAGDWALDRNGAVFLQGTEGTKIQNSDFERLDGNGVIISGYNRNTTVQDSDFAFIGGNAIVSWGYTNETENTGPPYYTPNTNFPEAGPDGTDGNHPRYNQILRNSAREVGLYEKQSSFYVHAKTAQATISGNVFFNGPRAGINFNDGFGGGDEISHNLVFSTCRESGDHGPFNSWDRQPFLTTVRTGEPSVYPAWKDIHHNFFIDNYSPQEGIDNDDGSSYFHSHHNFLIYGRQGLKNDFWGHDNYHSENIYAFVLQAVLILKDHDPMLEGHGDKFENNTLVMTGTDVGQMYCPGDDVQGEISLSNNKYFTPDGTLTECDKSLSQSQEIGMDQGSSVGEIPPDDTILRWASEMLGIEVQTQMEMVV